jgi:hypothetical protein
VKLFKVVLTISICFTITLGMENVFAGKLQPDLTCPSGSVLKNAISVMTLPYKYQKTSQEMDYLSINLLLDPYNESKGWLVLLNPVHGKPLENVQLKIKNTLGQLTATSDTPSAYQAPYMNDEIEDNNAAPVEFLQFCFYDVAGNANVDAVAVYLESGEDDNSPNNDSLKYKFQHNAKFHQNIMKLAKEMRTVLN